MTRKARKYVNPNTNKSLVTHIKDVPDIARTSPTLSVVKFKPPNLPGLTAHNEKTYHEVEWCLLIYPIRFNIC